MLYSKMDADFFSLAVFTHHGRSCYVVDHESIFSDLFEDLKHFLL